MLAFGSSEGGVGGIATHGVGLGGVEVGADDAVFLDLAEEVLGVQVGKCGRHFVVGGCFVFWLCCGWLGMCLVGAVLVERRGTEIVQSREEDCGGCGSTVVCLESS